MSLLTQRSIPCSRTSRNRLRLKKNPCLPLRTGKATVTTRSTKKGLTLQHRLHSVEAAIPALGTICQLHHRRNQIFLANGYSLISTPITIRYAAWSLVGSPRSHIMKSLNETLITILRSPHTLPSCGYQETRWVSAHRSVGIAARSFR